MADKPSRSSRFGKAVLWMTGLAALPGATRVVAEPIKDMASETRQGLRRHTPSWREARAAWQFEGGTDPAKLFAAYARKYGLTEERRLAQYQRYRWLTIASAIGCAAALVLIYWNISGVLLAPMMLLATLSCAYRRDALYFQRVVTFGHWIRERVRWIFA